MAYNTQMTFHFNAKDGVERYCRFRLVPIELYNGEVEESGFPDEEDQKYIWLRDRLPGDTRPSNYLRMEFKDRLQKGPVHYKLQIQIHTWNNSTSTHNIFNCGVDWDLTTHPFTDIADVVFTNALEDDVTEKLRFDTKNQPPSLGNVYEPYNKDSFTCLAYYRKKIYRHMQNLRLAHGLLRGDLKSFKNPVPYGIFVKTGHFVGEGSSPPFAKVKMMMVGINGTSKWHHLSHIFRINFERKSKEKFFFIDEDLGDLKYIKVKFHGEGWFLKQIKIQEFGNNKNFYFPANQWFEKKKSTRSQLAQV